MAAGTIFIEIARERYDHLSDGGSAYIAAPFAAKDDIKSLPTRRWDKYAKRWVIPSDDVQLAVQMLREQGWQVQVMRRGSTDQPTGSATAITWADGMFTALPQRLHTPAYKALTKVLHPDTGGDLAAMQTLTAARDRSVAA